MIKLRKSENLELANSLNGLGDVMSAQNHFEKALGYYLEAEKIISSSFLTYANNGVMGGKDNSHPLLASSKVGQGNVLARQGKYQEAQILDQKAIAILEYYYHHQHQELAKPKAALGAIYLCCGNYDQGQRLYNEAIKILSDIFGDNHPNIALYKADILTMT
ncbi:tetratricopeptide repeat protein [Geminocystis sp. GBBB08]|uniref:tetratricopeptide repeat protein n=1 Tax=Geminocystis sp. GBBB08 TaxID=2604140 RepID=UPI0027E2D778|nr:tetratricopeptide repeat protein [Geminocystis sp. GBBB08]MBL1209916.1 tetratricopeptide repeat protein [Geminocystis sp. GBBB08]